MRQLEADDVMNFRRSDFPPKLAAMIQKAHDVREERNRVRRNNFRLLILSGLAAMGFSLISAVAEVNGMVCAIGWLLSMIIMIGGTKIGLDRTRDLSRRKNELDQLAWEMAMDYGIYGTAQFINSGEFVDEEFTNSGEFVDEVVEKE